MTDFAIKTWENAIDGIAKAFAEKHFPEYADDAYWTGDSIGGVFCVSDWFFDGNHMLKALQLDATFEQVEEYYNAEAEHYGEDPDAVPQFTTFEYYMKHGLKPLIEE